MADRWRATGKEIQGLLCKKITMVSNEKRRFFNRLTENSRWVNNSEFVSTTEDAANVFKTFVFVHICVVLTMATFQCQLLGLNAGYEEWLTGIMRLKSERSVLVNNIVTK